MFLGCYELLMLRFWMLRILDATVLDALIVSRIWRHQSLEIAVLEVASFGGYDLGVFNTHPISMTSRTGVDTVIQPSCIMCITRFHQNISKI